MRTGGEIVKIIRQTQMRCNVKTRTASWTKIKKILEEMANPEYDETRTLKDNSICRITHRPVRIVRRAQ